MEQAIDHVRDLFRVPCLPRSRNYPVDWMVMNSIGPSALWLTELIAPYCRLEPGQSVLDLGCGTAIGSIFLANEYSTRVCAADLWIDPTDNWARIKDWNLQHLVFPMRCDAWSLPFAAGYFDAIVSVDAFQYFGMDAVSLERCARLLRPGGCIGIIVPGLCRELGGERPAHLSPFGIELGNLHTARWWSDLWRLTGLFDAVEADCVPDGAGLWLRWQSTCLSYGRLTGRWSRGKHADREGACERVLRMLERDGGSLIEFVRVVGLTSADGG